MADPTFECFALIEIFGHTRIAGKVTEQVIAGTGFIRVDVPELPPTKYHDEPVKPITKFYGPSAIYSITPVDEATCVAAAQALRVAPVSMYIAMPMLEKDDDDDEDGDDKDF